METDKALNIGSEIVWVKVLTMLVLFFFVLFGFWDHIWQCSRLIPGSALRSGGTT